MIRVGCDADGIAAAARAVSEGLTVAYPTDTVYALGCDPRNAEAVSAVYRIKGRDQSKEMPVLCPSAQEAWKLAEAAPGEQDRVGRFWPGALTVIAPLADPELAVSMGLHGGRIGVRVPAGECAAALLAACGPLVGTSANASGAPATRDPDFIGLDGIDVLVDGGILEGQGRASTIIELAGGGLRVVREGGITEDELRRAWI